MKMELLAPSGDFNKMKTALYYGADAVYLGGKHFTLRALADNFSDEEIKTAVEYAHNLGKKVYVTCNIFMRNKDVDGVLKHLSYLNDIKVDGVIMSDIGLITECRKRLPTLPVNVSTQSTVLNKFSVGFYRDLGVKRVILARELSLEEISEIHNACPEIELEAFVHGAMCISYSGRCLLSNYLADRDSNRGACVQACRWEYEIREKSKGGDFLPIEEDGKGTYILNSKDLNLINYLDELYKAGVVSLKIEGRMKSEYYLATVINAYRRALDDYYKNGNGYKDNALYESELDKTAHRSFTTAYALGKNTATVNYEDSQSKGSYKFIANVLNYADGYAEIEMRNRFCKGDVLQVLSPSPSFNKEIVVDQLKNANGELVTDAKRVQEVLYLRTDVKLSAGDILRRKFE